MGDFNYQFLLSLLIIALGYFIKRFNIVKAEDSGVISSIILNMKRKTALLLAFFTIIIKKTQEMKE